MKAYIIEQWISKKEYMPFITKFGGQPDWLAEPQWPVSPARSGRPLKFIGQIRLNDFYDELEKLTLAYIFLTQPKDRDDDFYDPDIIFTDEGENAIIIQPNGNIPEYIQVGERRTGPTVDKEQIWIPQITKMEEEETAEFEDIDIDKFCGIPANVYHTMSRPGSSLLLQLHTNWLPFYVNAGGAPVLFAFLGEKRDEGYLFIED